MKIREKRLELGLSQIQLADKLSVGQSAVAMWENGAAYPRVEILIKLSEIFGCTLDELVKGEENEVSCNLRKSN